MYSLFIIEKINIAIEIGEVVVDGGYRLMEWKVSEPPKHFRFCKEIKGTIITKINIRNKGIETINRNSITIEKESTVIKS